MIRNFGVSRRALLLGGSTLLVCRSGPARAGAALSIPDEVVEMEFEGSLPPLPESERGLDAAAPFRDYDGAINAVETRGLGAPTDEDVKLAQEIIACAPYGVAPWQVAQYFHDVGQGKYEEAWKPFAREWTKKANPLIVEFFVATSTRPAGDTTPWCAAFVNWCIARANSKNGTIGDDELKLTTRSALSGSFRCWDKAAPEIGDIAVFAQSGTESQTCSGKGHVGFYVGKTDDGKLKVLGGNQGLKGTTGAITIGLRRRSSEQDENRYVGLYGFRTSAALRRAAAPEPAPAAAASAGTTAAPAGASGP